MLLEIVYRLILIYKFVSRSGTAILHMNLIQGNQVYKASLIKGLGNAESVLLLFTDGSHLLLVS
jgi:hypothetical protein